MRIVPIVGGYIVYQSTVKFPVTGCTVEVVIDQTVTSLNMYFILHNVNKYWKQCTINSYSQNCFNLGL